MQREAIRWSQFSEQKSKLFSKVKSLKNAFNKTNDAYKGFIQVRQKKLGWLSSLVLVYDASKISTVYVVKSSVLGLQRAFFQKS